MLNLIEIVDFVLKMFDFVLKMLDFAATEASAMGLRAFDTIYHNFILILR